VRILVAAFVLAQFAGVNTSPLAETGPGAVASHVHHQYLNGAEKGTAGHHHGDHKAPFTEHCCALHVFFVGIVCPAITIETLVAASTRVAPPADSSRQTFTAGRLDRPPRPLV
jgi:hypothetical protein